MENMHIDSTGPFDLESMQMDLNNPYNWLVVIYY